MNSVGRSKCLIVIGAVRSFAVVVAILSPSTSLSEPEIVRDAPSASCGREFSILRAKFESLDRRLDRLDPRVHQWLTIRNANIPQHHLGGAPIKAVGERLAIGVGQYEVLARLGQGGEAVVYVVQTPSGLRVAKVFSDLDTMARNVSALKAEKSLPVPKIYAADPETKTLLMEYFEVLPVSVIEKSAGDFGISLSLRNEILSQWDSEKKRAHRVRSFAPSNVNVGYSFDCRCFKMFDPL